MCVLVELLVQRGNWQLSSHEIIQDAQGSGQIASFLPSHSFIYLFIVTWIVGIIFVFQCFNCRTSICSVLQLHCEFYCCSSGYSCCLAFTLCLLPPHPVHKVSIKTRFDK